MLAAAHKTTPRGGGTSTAVGSASCATAAAGGSATRGRRARTCTGWTRPRRAPGTCARATTGRTVISKGRRLRPRCRGTILARRRRPAADLFSRPRSAPSAWRRPSQPRARPAATWRARCASRARARTRRPAGSTAASGARSVARRSHSRGRRTLRRTGRSSRRSRLSRATASGRSSARRAHARFRTRSHPPPGLRPHAARLRRSRRHRRASGRPWAADSARAWPHSSWAADSETSRQPPRLPRRYSTLNQDHLRKEVNIYSLTHVDNTHVGRARAVESLHLHVRYSFLDYLFILTVLLFCVTADE